MEGLKISVNGEEDHSGTLEDTISDSGDLDDTKLRQLVQFQMAESLPGTDHCDICKTESETWQAQYKLRIPDWFFCPIGMGRLLY